MQFQKGKKAELKIDFDKKITTNVCCNRVQKFFSALTKVRFLNK